MNFFNLNSSFVIPKKIIAQMVCYLLLHGKRGVRQTIRYNCRTFGLVKKPLPQKFCEKFFILSN